MKDILDKISSYNIFNYLFPGVLFAVFVTKITSYQLLQADIATGVFVYYFLGLIVSRVGSLLIEPILKGIRFIQYSSYEDFVVASKNDPKIEVLSEMNNMYRTISSLLLLVSVFAGYEWIAGRYPFLFSIEPYVAIALLLALFLFSYRKQSQFVNKRVGIKKVSS
ncbi:MAG: hypothetical protein IPG33_13300 [Betaproteobacteria bacterium]|jgi:hypothetical protein|nr:hypothetical protein [Betaproteobacteria bacterium]